MRVFACKHIAEGNYSIAAGGSRARSLVLLSFFCLFVLLFCLFSFFVCSPFLLVCLFVCLGHFTKKASAWTPFEELHVVFQSWYQESGWDPQKIPALNMGITTTQNYGAG